MIILIILKLLRTRDHDIEYLYHDFINNNQYVDN